MEKLKKLWAELTAPYDDGIEYSDAVDIVCGKCRFGDRYCSLCPVKLSYSGNDGDGER